MASQLRKTKAPTLPKSMQRTFDLIWKCVKTVERQGGEVAPKSWGDMGERIGNYHWLRAENVVRTCPLGALIAVRDGVDDIPTPVSAAASILHTSKANVHTFIGALDGYPLPARSRLWAKLGWYTAYRLEKKNAR